MCGLSFTGQAPTAIGRGLEEARQSKLLATAQEAQVILATGDENLFYKLASQIQEAKLLAQVPDLQVQKLEAVASGQGLEALEMPGLFIQVARAPGEKCIRCWFHLPSVGENPDHPLVCARCRSALGV